MTVLERFIQDIERRRYKDGEPMPEPLLRLGLIGELGEVCDLVKKVEWHGKTLDREELILELGDVCWYAVALALDHKESVSKPHRSPYKTKLWADVVDLSDYVCIRYYGPSTATLFAKVSDIAAHVGATLDDVLEANMAKLAKRYPNGFVEGGGIR